MTKKAIAKSLEVCTKTIRNWEIEYLEEKDCKLGRPPIPFVERIRVARKVKVEWLRQGKPGYRPVASRLKDCSEALVIKYVRMLKEKDRKEEWEFKRKESKRIEVKHKDVMWTQDATYLKENEKRTYAEVLKDRCTLEIEVKKVNAMNTENVLSILKGKKILPLVYATDNGSAYCSKEMEKFLKENRVIHLKNLPATPQHNGAAEVAVREVKRISNELGHSGFSLSYCLKKAMTIMNEVKLWRKHGYKTAKEKAHTACLKNLEELRDKIYRKYQKGLMWIEKTFTNKIQRRLEERELVFSLLEEHKLIERYRGSQNYAL